MAKMLTGQQVKDALQIDSFRNLSKEKIMEFTSLVADAVWLAVRLVGMSQAVHW